MPNDLLGPPTTVQIHINGQIMMLDNGCMSITIAGYNILVNSEKVEKLFKTYQHLKEISKR